MNANVGFPFLLGGTFIEAQVVLQVHAIAVEFPFLLGGTFIEAPHRKTLPPRFQHFPSFWEGLSLRHLLLFSAFTRSKFPFLLGGTFIEARCPPSLVSVTTHFPSFWEGLSLRRGNEEREGKKTQPNFPSFWEGLSLRPSGARVLGAGGLRISLPFGRDFH